MKWAPAAGEKWEPITCDAGTFDVQVRRPTYQQRNQWFALRASDNPAAGRSKADALAEANAYCVDVAIVDWRGLTDMDGQPIPFSLQALQALCRDYPKIHNEFLILGINAFSRTVDPADPKGDPGGN